MFNCLYLQINCIQPCKATGAGYNYGTIFAHGYAGGNSQTTTMIFLSRFQGNVNQYRSAALDLTVTGVTSQHYTMTAYFYFGMNYMDKMCFLVLFYNVTALK